MTIALARPLRSGLAVPAVVALVAVVTFIGLGSWQLQRKAWKEALIESLEQRLSASPGDLPARERWASLAPANDEFRRVKFSAAFVPGAEANRLGDTGPVTPLLCALIFLCAGFALSHFAKRSSPSSQSAAPRNPGLG